MIAPRRQTVHKVHRAPRRRPGARAGARPCVGSAVRDGARALRAAARRRYDAAAAPGSPCETARPVTRMACPRSWATPARAPAAGLPRGEARSRSVSPLEVASPAPRPHVPPQPIGATTQHCACSRRSPCPPRKRSACLAPCSSSVSGLRSSAAFICRSALLMRKGSTPCAPPAYPS